MHTDPHTSILEAYERTQVKAIEFGYNISILDSAGPHGIKSIAVYDVYNEVIFNHSNMFFVEAFVAGLLHDADDGDEA